MKKAFFLLLIFSSLVFAQLPKESLLKLKSKINIELKEDNNGLLGVKFEKKKPILAILYSLLLPGMGELYAESFDKGKYFTIADAVLWGTVAGFNIYGNYQKDNYIAFAQSYAGIDPSNKDDQFYADIGYYDDINQFNSEKELNRRFDETYNPETYYWQWDSDARRKEFRSIWLSSENAFNNIRFAVGALVLNRIISAINAVRLVSAYNKKHQEALSWNVSFGVGGYPNLPSSFNVNFIAKF